MGFHLTKEAKEDIIRTFLEGAEYFGISQAEKYHAGLQHTYGILADHPKLRGNAMSSPRQCTCILFNPISSSTKSQRIMT